MANALEDNLVKNGRMGLGERRWDLEREDGTWRDRMGLGERGWDLERERGYPDVVIRCFFQNPKFYVKHYK
jgi:hypothetical protein